MNMNNIFTKLRKRNKGNYHQLIFCITFGILLITSFASTVFSPTIQNVLEDGGDSRKLVWMIFAIAIIGCLLFSVYAVGLFLKYKSHENGVFLALGTPKKVLSKALYTELIKVLLPCAVAGIFAGVLISFGIWQGFSQIFMDNDLPRYQFSLLGIVAGAIYSIIIIILTLILAMQFMKRSNLMDILNDEKKTETVKAVPKNYGVSGVIFLILGLLLGYGVPIITGNFFNFLMPSFWSITYLLSLIGMYRIITFAISYNKRGRNPQKYYKKLISSSMMKFQGKQTVRNMLVIALLIGASLFALSYIPMMGLANLWLNAKNPTDFALHYKLSMDEVTKNDIYELAEQYQVKIIDYRELIFSELVGSGVERDFNDNGMLVEDFQDKYLFSEFTSETDYNQTMNTYVIVPKGQYILLLQPESFERVWTKYNDLNLVTNIDTEKNMPLSIADTLENHSLARYESQRYILNDEDYAQITLGILPENQTRQILFNVENPENSYQFAKALFSLFVEKAPAELGRMLNYDAYQHALATKEGREYSYARPVELTAENPELFGNWKYYPTMKILIEKTFFKEFSVKFLLFVYVAIICLSAVGIIAYTRSISVGLSNKKLFDDLEKLGANKKFISKLITSQLNKIFIIPTIIGSILIIMFGLLISFGGDGQFTPTDGKVFGVNLIITAIVWVYLLIIYGFSLKKTKKIAGNYNKIIRKYSGN